VVFDESRRYVISLIDHYCRFALPGPPKRWFGRQFVAFLSEGFLTRFTPFLPTTVLSSSSTSMKKFEHCTKPLRDHPGTPDELIDHP
jgi:hypothetical protein